MENEFFFDRSPRSFYPILNFYRTGKLHLAEDVCAISFSDDLTYWGITDVHFDVCCLPKYRQKKEFVNEEVKKVIENQCHDFVRSTGSKNWVGLYQKFLWDLLEVPTSSKAARVS